MNKQPISVTINLAIILFNAIIWLALGVIIAFNLHPAIPDIPGMRLGLTIISLIIVAFLGVVVYLLRKHNRNAYYLSLAFFIGTSILTFFDEVGAADIVFLLFTITPIILLLKDRKWYTQPKSKPSVEQ